MALLKIKDSTMSLQSMSLFLVQRSIDPLSGFSYPPFSAALPVPQELQFYQTLACYDSINEEYQINRIKYTRETEIEYTSKSAGKSGSASLVARLHNHLNILSYHLQNQFKIFPDKCHYAAVNALDLDQIDGEYLISGSNDGRVKLWNVQECDAASQNANQNQVVQIGEIAPQFNTDENRPDTNNRTMYGHNYGISQVKWWPFDTGIFVSSSFDKTVKLWDTETLLLLYTFNNDKMMPTLVPELYSIPSSTFNSTYFGQIYSVDFSSTLQHGLLGIASQGTSFVKILDVKSATVANYLFGHTSDSITSVKWNPVFPNILATGSNGGEIKVWDIRRGDSCIYTLNMLDNSAWDMTGLKQNSPTYSKAHTRAVNGLVWAPDGTGLVSVGMDNSIKWWDLQKAKLTDIVGGRSITKNALESQLKRRRQLNRRRQMAKSNGLADKAHATALADPENPTIDNKFLQTINPIITTQPEGNYLFYPSSKISIFNMPCSSKPKLMRELKRTDLAHENLLDGLEPERYCSIVHAGGSKNKYYTGTLNGLIYTWGPQYDVLDDDSADEDTNYAERAYNLKNAKTTEIFNGIYIPKT